MTLKGNWSATDRARERVANNGVVVHGIGKGKSYLETIGLEKPGADRPSDRLLRERDERYAADDRTDVEKLMGVPVPAKSALGHRATE
jgi:hypothetical protein